MTAKYLLMIKHIVSIQLKDEDKDKAQVLKKALEDLPSKIKEIRAFEVGLNISEAKSAFDLVLVSDFDSLDDLNIYRQHPEHVKVLELIARYKTASIVVDYQK